MAERRRKERRCRGVPPKSDTPRLYVFSGGLCEKKLIATDMRRAWAKWRHVLRDASSALNSSLASRKPPMRRTPRRTHAFPPLLPARPPLCSPASGSAYRRHGPRFCHCQPDRIPVQSPHKPQRPAAAVSKSASCSAHSGPAASLSKLHLLCRAMLRLPASPRPQMPPFSRSHFPPPLSRLRPYPHNRRRCCPVLLVQHYSNPSATAQQPLPVPAPLWRKSPSAAARPPLLSAGPPQNGNFTTQSQLRSRSHYNLLCTHYHLYATFRPRSPRYPGLIPNSQRANLYRQNEALAPTLRRCLSGRPCECPGPTASHSCPAHTLALLRAIPQKPVQTFTPISASCTQLPAHSTSCALFHARTAPRAKSHRPHGPSRPFHARCKFPTAFRHFYSANALLPLPLARPYFARRFSPAPICRTRSKPALSRPAAPENSPKAHRTNPPTSSAHCSPPRPASTLKLRSKRSPGPPLPNRNNYTPVREKKWFSTSPCDIDFVDMASDFIGSYRIFHASYCSFGQWFPHQQSYI